MLLNSPLHLKKISTVLSQHHRVVVLMFVLPLASALQISEGEKPKPPQLRQHLKQEENTVPQAEKDSCFPFLLFSLFLISEYRLFLSVSFFFFLGADANNLKLGGQTTFNPWRAAHLWQHWKNTLGHLEG